MNYKLVNDYEVVYMIKENDDEAKNLLFKKYIPVVSKIATKYLSYAKKYGAEFDDLMQEGMIALNKAIFGFNERNAVLFYTYASICIERHLITYCKRLNNKKNYYLNFSLSDDYYYCISDQNSSLDVIFNEYLKEEEFSFYKNFLNLKYSSVFELRYNGFSYKEISKLLDISVGTVDARMSRIRKILKEKCKMTF